MKSDKDILFDYCFDNYYFHFSDRSVSYIMGKIEKTYGFRVHLLSIRIHEAKKAIVAELKKSFQRWLK